MAEVALTAAVLELIKVLAEALTSLSVRDAFSVQDLRGDVQQIKDDLEMMLAALKVADQMQSTNPIVEAWVNQVREVARDTKNVMDDFQTVPSPPSGCTTGCLWRLCHRSSWDQIANRIHKMQRRIHEVSERRNLFDPGHLSSPSSTSYGAETSSTSYGAGTSSTYSSYGAVRWRPDDSRLLAQSVEESQIVGNEKPKAQLTQRLLGSESRLEVIPVVGMPGVGKTTLIRKMYEDPAVKQHFKYCAWITVSQQFNVMELLKRLIKQFNLFSRKRSSEDLAKTLRDFLKGKRYVVFIDDIWSVDAWNIIKCAFPENKFGSRIMVTTRSQEVADSCAKPHENVFPLDPLTDKDAWSLFCKTAFTSDADDGKCPPELEPTARNILNKCGGLPLAIVTIGCLLTTRAKTRFEWEIVYRTLGTELVGGTVKKVLSLSYDDLPSHLRPCFLYLGIYPPSYEIKRAEVCRQWIAEGFISPLNGATIEDASYRYLQNLAQRNLVLVGKVDCFGRMESCQVHDLMHEFIVRKSQEQNFHTSLQMQGEADRLAIYSGLSWEGVRFPPQTSHFRSLFLFGPGIFSSLETFHSLKVLSLHGIEMDSFASSILDLIHLTYLCLRRTMIETVPKTIKKLKNLQTLDLKYTLVTELPKEIIQLQGLRHLLVSNIYSDGAGTGAGVKFPTELGKLRSMQNLSILDATDGSVQLKELEKLTQLKRLSITSVNSQVGNTLCKSISKMVHLQSLSISTRLYFDLSDPSIINILDINSFSTPSNELRSIKLTGILWKLPNNLLSLASLVKLQLQNSHLTDDPLQALGGLPCLAELRMLLDAYTGVELHAKAQSFPNLKTLYIGNLFRLEHITLEQGTMPRLEFFAISNVAVGTVPLGIEHLNHLKEIQLPEELLRDVFKKQGEDWLKLQQIATIRQCFFVGGRWYSYPVD